MNGRSVVEYLRSLMNTMDSGRPLHRPEAPRWVRSVAIPVSIGLSLGMGACIGEELPDESPYVDDGKADVWGDETAQSSSCLTPPEVCGDGLDNDGDGFTDCIDYDCFDDDACAGIALYAAPMEQDCENGEDDQGNGLVDCEDLDCQFHCACVEE